MDKIATLLFELLRRMDAEASSVNGGHATGLNWYGGHIRPDQKRPQTERNWTRDLAERLSQSGIKTRCEASYPTLVRKRCDLVLTLPDASTLWLEVRGAWKEYWRQRGGSDWIYRSYLLHPLVEGLDQSKTHTAALDLRKLETLQKEQADHAGLLLIGFDSMAGPMDDDVAEFIRLARLGADPWQAHYSGWSDPHRNGESVKCWLWSRSA